MARLRINDGLTNYQRYYARHKEKRSEDSRRKYLETGGDYWRQYYAKNKDKYSQTRKKYALEHPEYRRDYAKKYYAIEANRVRLAQMATKPHRRYKNAIRTAKFRQIGWNLSESDFNALISKRCFYCDGSLPSQGSGLDRVDNSKGYSFENVVPCCTSCNQIRGNNLTSEEMLIAMDAIKKFRLNKIIADVKGAPIRP